LLKKVPNVCRGQEPIAKFHLLILKANITSANGSHQKQRSLTQTNQQGLLKPVIYIDIFRELSAWSR
jgi:hypothetical protein